MKNTLAFTFISFFLLLSCQQSNLSKVEIEIPPERAESEFIMSEMKFETDAKLYQPYRCPRPWVNRWITVYGNQTKDSTTVSEGKYSLRLKDNNHVYYYLDASRIEGDSLLFTGKYKFNNANKGKLYYYILQKDRYESIEHPPIPDSLIINNINGNADWNSFSIKAKLKDDIHEIRFGLDVQNIKDVWIDDWDIQVDSFPVYRYVKTHYPAEEDKEFDNGSGISLGELTPTMQHNLETLARVWGFMKYYHPKVTDGDINWDYELFRILPKVASATNKENLNNILTEWIDQYGDFPVKTYTVTDKELYSCFIDNSWINDKKVFTDKVIERLNKIESAIRKEKVNYYMIPFGGGARDRNFRAEKAYENVKWDDQGFRLLTLFRFWNVIEYNFPYKYLTDTPWREVLSNHFTGIFSPESEADYYANVVKLTAEIDDSHGGLQFRQNTEGTPVARYRYNRYPVKLTETLDGEFCVEASYTSELNIGDVIHTIDGKPVREVFNTLIPYTTASNKETISRNIRPALLSSKNKEPLKIEIIRDGKIIPITLKNYSSNNSSPTTVKEMAEYEKENKNIIFLNVGTTRSDQLVAEVKKNMSAKGIIFDLRQYPRDFMSFFKLSDVLLPDTTINLWFSSQDLAFPGNYKKYNECPLGFTNPDYFKGKVAILVNEGTQSLGEMTSIALSYAPKAKVIGTTTSGADGNVTRFVLPGNMTFTYTVLGAYYPEWGQCQRTGVKIDIQARPTVDDLRNKKDALIERAIQYINE